MDLSKIVKAIESIKPKDERPKGAFTTRELMKARKSSERDTYKTIRNAVESGKMEFVGKFPIRNISGSISMSPMYRMVK